MVLNYFGKKNLVYASIAGIIRESGFCDIAVKIPATMIINLHTFIWLLQKVILHMRIYSSYDSSYECNIASNKQIETCEFYNMNQNSIIDFTKRHNKK